MSFEFLELEQIHLGSSYHYRISFETSVEETSDFDQFWAISSILLSVAIVKIIYTEDYLSATGYGRLMLSEYSRQDVYVA